MKKTTFDINRVIAKLVEKAKEYKTPIVELIEAQTKEPWKVLVATILSARTTDTITSRVTEKLFKKIKSLNDFTQYSPKEIEHLIFPIGFYRNKAKFLHKLPTVLEEKFNGTIPETIDELIQLPGVGRKTANLVVAVGFMKPAICVDTHVHRIMNIWGYVKTKTPLETEMTLRKKLPMPYWIQINYLLVSHGQSICRPISPHCDECVIASECPKLNVKPRRVKLPRKTSSTTKKYRLISWNVNGIRAASQKGLLQFMRTTQADIVALQEIKAHKDQLPKEITSVDGYHKFWASAKKKGYSGVCVYSKIQPKKVIYGIDIKEFDDEGRAITLEFDSFYLINCYFPNAQHELKRLDYKLRFNKRLRELCVAYATKKAVLLCGDLNVAHKEIDLKNPKTNKFNPGFSKQERESMDIFLESGFTDTFRLFNPQPDNYTWWSYRFNARQKNIGWRIDYFCIDSEHKDNVIAADILADIMGSDHCPISVEIMI